MRQATTASMQLGERDRLSAGGNRIRTIGPAANGTAMGGPPKSILAISDLTLGGSTDRRADVPIGNAQQSLLQQRDRWFESGFLHRRVLCERLKGVDCLARAHRRV